MNISKAIIHYIDKEINSVPTSKLSNIQLDIDDSTTNLINILDNSYKDKNITYAIMQNENGHTFPRTFSNYWHNRTIESFIQFTQNQIEILCQILANIRLAKGGYFLFCEYLIGNKSYLSIYLLRNTNGILFEHSNENNRFEIDTIKHLDVDKLAMACRIDCSKFINNEGKCLSFIKHNQKDISEYFLNWIAAAEKESSVEYTEELFKILARIDCPLVNDSPMDRSDFHQNVYDYIKSKPDKIINIKEISNHFYGDENKISEYANEIDLPINTEFKYNDKIIKKLVRIDINCDGIKMRFSRSALNETIRMDGNLVIIESQSMVNAIQAQIV